MGQKNTPLLLAIYFEAKISKETPDWELQEKKMHEFESKKPYVIITIIATNDRKVKHAGQLAQELFRAQKRFRHFWITFMTQHPQFLFKIDFCEKDFMQENLPHQLSNLYNFAKSQKLDTVLFQDGTLLIPKHIFTEYPTVVFNFQVKAKGKEGALII